MESTQAKDLKGKITRWTTSKWGIANYYVNGEMNPRKIFVHEKFVVSEDKPAMGSYIVFDLGPGRSSAELPAAVNVRVIRSAEAL